MNRRRVGEDRGSKETDGCPLTLSLVYSRVCVVFGLSMNYHSDLRPMDLASLQVQYSRNSLSTTMHGTPSPSCPKR
jgi:hypothetical protein